MSALDRITVDPAVCGGRPCIRGLRIRVKDVLDLLAAGATHDEILADYPYLESDDIAAVLAFAARQNGPPRPAERVGALRRRHATATLCVRRGEENS